MDPTRFDRFSTLFAERRLSRRHAFTTSGAAIAGRSAAAQDATPEATLATAGEKISYLFVQSFQSGSIAPTEGRVGRYTVTLEQGLGSTIYFADRPSRDVGTTPTPQFLEGLGFSEDNPPNAALLMETVPGETDFAVVELYNPSYDPTTRGVTYEVEVLGNWEDDLELGFSEAPADLAALAPAFRAAHLLIDDCSADTVYCRSNTDGSDTGEFHKQPFCWNYNATCMPCEPYAHSQPDRCATHRHWNDNCNNQIVACAGAGCFSSWLASDLFCEE